MIDPTDSSGSEDDGEEEDGDNVEYFDGEEILEEDDEPNEFAPSAQAGPSRPRPKSLYAPPTAQEMDRLRSAAENGNTFTLQLEALLSSTLLSASPAPRLKAILSRIHDLILSLPTLPALSVREAAKRTKEIPFPGGDIWSPLKQDVKWTLGWEKPAEVFVGGSWSVCGGYKKGKGVMGDVDLVVVMPEVSQSID
jgi:U3 small nucleolar RNA-associated protein 22